MMKTTPMNSFQNRNIFTGIENNLMVTKAGRGEEGQSRSLGLTDTLYYI